MKILEDSVNSRQAPENVAAGSETKDPLETNDMDAAKNSVAYNWASY